MVLSAEYQEQYQWRSWQTVYDAMGDVTGQHILDVGCAVGDQSADFAAKGAIVTGIDGNANLLAKAKAKNIANARFIHADLTNLTMLAPECFDFIWCSFVIAYFPLGMAEILTHLKTLLKPGGKLVLTEMAGLLNHHPMSKADIKTLAAFYNDASQSNRYDFLAGANMEKAAKEAGFAVFQKLVLDDAELCFVGPARPQVLNAWQNRISRMGGLQKFAGPDFCARFLQTLQQPDHITECVVSTLICAA